MHYEGILFCDKEVQVLGNKRLYYVVWLTQLNLCNECISNIPILRRIH